MAEPEPEFPFVYAREWDHVVTARSPRNEWLQFIVIAPPGVAAPLAVVHMKPALLGGWNFSHVDWQSAEDWPGMSPLQILAWKERSLDTSRREATEAERTRVLEWLAEKVASIDSLG